MAIKNPKKLIMNEIRIFQFHLHKETDTINIITGAKQLIVAVMSLLHIAYTNNIVQQKINNN